jgi:gliding motility-associated-like protein
LIKIKMKPIKKIIFSLFTILYVATFAQNKIQKSESISIERYAELKSKGLLDPNVSYAIGGSQTQLEQVQAYQAALAQIEANKEKNKFSKSAGIDSCNCFQKVDSTYSIVAISGGNPPEYRNDDGSSPAINLPFTFKFFGINYTSCYINNNGSITFSNPDPGYIASGFPTNSGKPMIAPFWADVDTRNLFSGLPRYKITPHYMVVSWDTVGYFDTQANLRNTFQLVISDGTDSIVKGSGNVAFCYGDMQWTTGSASGGVNGFGDTAATVGFDKGDGVKFAQLGRFNATGAAYDGPGGNRDGVDWLDNKSFSFNTISSTNFPPISVGSAGECNVISVCNTYDTLYYEAKFIGPELNQTVSIVANLPALPNFFIKSNTSGITAKIIVGVVNDGINTGVYNFNVVASDNLGASTAVFFKVNLLGSGSVCPSAVITAKDPVVCKGKTTTLYRPLCGKSTGIWNTGSIADSIVGGIGEYYYTVIDTLGCSKSFIYNLQEAPNAFPKIKGPDTLCSSTKYYYTLSNSFDFTTYKWQNMKQDTGIVIDANTFVDSTRITVTAINTYGCVEKKSKKIIVVPAFQLSVDRTGSDPINQACPLEVSTYKAKPLNPIGNFQYTWFDVNTNNDIGFADSISVIGPRNISVLVKKQNFCALVKNVKITARPPIATTIKTNKPNNIICPVDTLKLRAEAFKYFPPYTYQWSPALDTTGIIIPKQDTVYSVIIKDTKGCKGFANFEIIRQPNIEMSANAFCKGDTSLIEVKSFTGIKSVVWNSKASGNSFPNDSIIKINKADEYSTVLIDANNCKMFDTLVVNYFFQPSLVINSTASSPQAINSNFDLALAIQPYNAKFFKSIQWDFGDSTFDSTKIKVAHQYKDVKKYFVKVSLLDTNGCRLFETIAIQIFDLIPEVNFFTPNGDGINDQLAFKYLEVFQNNKLKVFDRWGKLAFEKDNYTNDWSPKDLPDGTYFFVLDVSSTDYKKKINGYITLAK